ncbi:MAG: HlyD family efflux transporter periplasmic adaptor subunit [Proteobacteria bacterium]|nr:HlyD family efflux transporter periplasmic adaptor subunit [Pseudomonadota bacterium]
MPSTTTEARKTISSPEQLDQLMTVTSPQGWLGLWATIALLATLVLWGIYGEIPLQVEGPGMLLYGGGLRTVSCVNAGRVLDVLVKPGDTVELGQVVMRVQSLTQYPATATTPITSPFAGTVTQIMAKPGAVVQVGDTLMNTASVNDHLEAVLYLPLDKGKKVVVGQAVQVTVSTVDREKYGYLVGTIKEVATYASTNELMRETLGNENLVQLFQSGGAYQGAPLKIKVRLQGDLSTPSGYHWSSDQGPPFAISPGTVCTAAIATGSERPMDMVVPYLLKRFGAEPQQ